MTSPSDNLLSGSFEQIDILSLRILSAYQCLETQRDLYRCALDYQTKELRYHHRYLYPQVRTPEFIYIKTDDEIKELCVEMYKEIVWCYARMPIRYHKKEPSRLYLSGQLTIAELTRKMSGWGIRLPKIVF